MQITRKDVFWNYLATFLKIASSVILLPLILKMMPTEKVGIWTIFMTITAFSSLLDFGFNPSFTRNITYVFSGVSALVTTGFNTISADKQTLDYGLLKGVISAMKWLYFRMSIVLFLLLSTIGTFYIYTILKNYKGDPQEIYSSWILLCLINTYNIYTLYYDSLLQGKGLVKKSKQIIIIGYIVYLAIACFLILQGYGLIAIVSAQASSVIVIRILSYRSFFTKEITQNLKNVTARSKEEIMKAIYPNAFKIGLTSLGGFAVQKSALLIGSLYLSLGDIASYGITMQLLSVMAGLGSIYIMTFIPKIVHLRVRNEIDEIKNIYIRGQRMLIITFVFGGIFLLLCGNWILGFLGSKTSLVSFWILLLAVIMTFIETNLSNAGSILLTKNEVPFFKASLLSGFFVIIGLLFCFKYIPMGLFTIVVIPMIVSLSYQGWKWPNEVNKDLKIKFMDFINSKI